MLSPEWLAKLAPLPCENLPKNRYSLEHRLGHEGEIDTFGLAGRWLHADYILGSYDQIQGQIVREDRQTILQDLDWMDCRRDYRLTADVAELAAKCPFHRSE